MSQVPVAGHSTGAGSEARGGRNPVVGEGGGEVSPGRVVPGGAQPRSGVVLNN